MDQRKAFPGSPKDGFAISRGLSHWERWHIQGHVKNKHLLRTSSASHKPGRRFLLQEKKSQEDDPNMIILECMVGIG